MQEIVSSAPSRMKEAYRAMRMMFTMALACIAAVVVGHQLDTWLHTTPLCLLVLLAYAIIASLYLMIRKLGDDDG